MPKRGENIYKRKDGRWEGRVKVEGSSQKKSIYGYSYREVKLKLAEYKQSAPEAKTPSLTFERVFEEWLMQKKTIVKTSTFNKYRNLCVNYILPELGNLKIAEISSTKVNALIANLLTKSDGSGLSPKTIRDVCMLIKACLKYASVSYSIPINQLELYIPSAPQKEIHTLSPAEQKMLEECLLKSLDLRKLGIIICLYTGLRIGEICALKWQNVNLDSGTIFICSTIQRVQTFDGLQKTQIIESTPKSQCSIRTIPLPETLVELMKPYSEENDEAYILTGSDNNFIEPRLYEYVFEKYVSEAGISSVNFHALRHTFATRCIELDFDIKSLSEILGHANTKITLDRYVHPSIERKRLQMNRLSF